jgi:hypothetical protein
VQHTEARVDVDRRDVVCLQPVADTVRQLEALREREAALGTPEAVTRAAWARLVSARLARVPQDRGLPTLAGLMAQVSSDEAAARGLPVGVAPPDRLLPIVARSLEATVEELVEIGVIDSAETLARVVPQLEAQLSPSELPWAARAALGRVVDVALCAWPEALLPDALVRELRALADRAGVTLPLVDEIAADGFTGELGEPYLRAAQRAARFLAGTLYATYYDLPLAQLASLEDVATSRWGTRISPGLTSLCMTRAGASSPFGSPAHNATILEQAQILTTHNLSVLVGGLGLSPRVAAKLPALARRSWDEVVRLRSIPHAAGAWRQMIFFASVMPTAGRDAFIRLAGERLAEQPASFRARFGPAYAGLCLAATGITPGPHTAPEACVFLGWSPDPHWLLR